MRVFKYGSLWYCCLQKHINQAAIMKTQMENKNALISDKSLIIYLIMLRNRGNNNFSALPKDVTNYMINLFIKPPNIFDEISSAFISMCNNYKNDYLLFKNSDEKIVCEVEELIKMLMIQRDADEKRALIHLSILAKALYEILQHNKNEKCMGKLFRFAAEYNLLGIDFDFLARKVRMLVSNDMNTNEQPTQIPLKSLFCRIISKTRSSKWALYSYLESGDFQEKNRIQIFTVINNLYDNVSTEKKHKLIALEKEIEHHLSQPCNQPSSSLNKMG